MSADGIRSFLEKWSIHPLALKLLIEFSRTEDGKRFLDGLPLSPQFSRTVYARKPSQYGRSIGIMTLDWVDDDE